MDANSSFRKCGSLSIDNSDELFVLIHLMKYCIHLKNDRCWHNVLELIFETDHEIRIKKDIDLARRVYPLSIPLETLHAQETKIFYNT